MTKKQQYITGAGEILDRRHPPTADDLNLRAAFRDDMVIAEMIYEARTDAGLSQRAFAKLVGTSASVICQLEDADYEGHSMAMLRRVAAALHQRVEVRFVPRDDQQESVPA
ncbi:MAG: helix-turn-helix transcriptional regulator [Phycisphaerales bacterium]|nr:helix-turn-helix transcriptional regulator [Phycisphaerales bacterium]